MPGHKRKRLKKKGTLPAHAPEWTTMFIITLSSTGNVAAACRAANVPRRTAYNHYRDYPQFAEVWDDAREEALDKLEGMLWKFGAEGSERAIEFILRGRRDIFRDAGVAVQVNNYMSPEQEQIEAAAMRQQVDEMTGRMATHKMIEESNEDSPPTD